MWMLLVLLHSLLANIPGTLTSVTTVGDLSILEGRSITAPCHYDPQYANHVKYWCQGKFMDLCTVLARTDALESSDERVTILDDPTQQLFTVTMTNLKEADSGWYHCGVELGTRWTADVSASLYISVVHGMSVVNSRVSGAEGTSVTVECLYSERYRDSEKRWCRSGDQQSCLATGPGGRYEDSSVAIGDDRSGAFAVTLKDLQMADTGWYWCAVGRQQTAVQVLVAPRPSTTAVTLVTSSVSQSPSVPFLSPPRAEEPWVIHRHMLELVVVCVSLTLLVGMVMLASKIRNQHKKEHRLRQAEELNARLCVSPCDERQAAAAAIVFLNRGSEKVDLF